MALAMPQSNRRRAALAAEAMAVPVRRIRAAGTYFVTSRTWQSRRLFINEDICNAFMETLLKYRNGKHYLLHASVLMPEHFHVLITPSEETSLERAVQFIKGGSARRIREERLLNFPVWQKGFSDHRIRDFHDYKAHVRYIEDNPVKRGLAVSSREYKWSSAAGYFVLDDVPQRLKPPRAAAIRHG
jgi:putative transposase